MLQLKLNTKICVALCFKKLHIGYTCVNNDVVLEYVDHEKDFDKYIFENLDFTYQCNNMLLILLTQKIIFYFAIV